jgi:lipopolysaccharide export system protein LptA
MRGMPIPSKRIFIALVVTLTVGIATLHAQQPSTAPPNALQGFSQNRDKPIKINSSTLEVRDKDKMATFAGDVHLVQGDTTMRSKTLVVFYDDDAASTPAKPPPGTAQAGAQQNQQIKRVEAKGNVIVTQKDQTATGESGIFDMRANTVTLSGNVAISQGQNIVKGDTLTVDMTTGVSRIGCAKPPCKVQALIQPGATKLDGHGQETAPTPTRETPRPRPLQPETTTAPATQSNREAPRTRPLQPQGLY